MVADQFLSYVQKWGLGRTVNLNDYSDKFHYLLMTIFLTLFATITTVRQYVFQPLVCEFASHPSGVNFADYANNLCWVDGTYSQVDPETADLDVDDQFWKKQPKAFYYQWIPFTLAVQAAMFFLPRLLWLAYIHNREGPDLEALLESTAEANRAADWELRRRLIDGVSRSIDYMLLVRTQATNLRSGDSRRKRWRRYLFSRRPRGCLPLIYVLIKLLFLGNALVQMYLMGVQLAPDSPAPFLFGFRLIAALSNGSDWRATRYFPRVTLCRIRLSHLAAKNDYVGQCILPLNMFNEKIYCFLWVAAAFGASLSCLSLVQWAMRLTCGHGRWRHHLRGYLVQQMGRARLAEESRLVFQFADHLHTDGVFLVHMLRLNVGEIIACDVTNALYALWLERYRSQLAENSDAEADADADPDTDADAEKGGGPSAAAGAANFLVGDIGLEALTAKARHRGVAPLAPELTPMRPPRPPPHT